MNVFILCFFFFILEWRRVTEDRWKSASFKVYFQNTLQIGFLGQGFPEHVWALNISGRPALIHWHRLSLGALAGRNVPIKTRFFWISLPCAVNLTFPGQRSSHQTNCQSLMPLHKLSKVLTQTCTLNMHYCSEFPPQTSLHCHSCPRKHRLGFSTA